MLQPARVLPSNAPPLQEGTEGLQQPSRVLQEHLDDRQQHQKSATANEWDQTKPFCDQQKYSASVLTGEYAFPRQHAQQQQHQHQHLYHPQPQHRHAWRYGYRGSYDQIDEAKIQNDADRLYRRFQQSDQYLKYRSRQSKQGKGKEDQKWPDHLEKAFFRALITYPPMGRRKQLLKKKQRGRNELIADCIEELTGEIRSRKQVSSHIQVLKPFVAHDLMIVKWLSRKDMGTQCGRYHIHPYTTGRGMSGYPVTAPPHSMTPAMPALQRTDESSVQQLKQSPQAFEPADFQMFIQRKSKQLGQEEMIDRLHTYTQAVPQPLAEAHPMSDWQTLARDFPHLKEANAQRPLDCTVLIAEASLAFPTESMEKWKHRADASIELGIYFQCRSRQLPAPRPGMKSPISLVNRFYDRGVEVKDFSETTEVYFHNVQDSAAVETEIKFGSKFWARTLGHVGNKMRDPVQLTPQQRDEVGDYVSSLNALQEVYVASERGPERIVIIHWGFRLSSGNCGRASWRRLILPDSEAVQQKIERTDWLYDSTHSLVDLTSSHQQAQPLPALQSPFEYDNSSSGSALSSATWPTSFSDGSVVGGPGDFGADNSFDFNAGSINIAYDPTLSFDNFDSSAFNFDDSNIDFATDPALEVFSQQPWYDQGFDDTQRTIGVGDAESSSFATQPDLVVGNQMYAGYGGQYNGETYAVSHDQQAYGGARPDLIKDDDALAALADATSWARTIGDEVGK